MQPVPTWKVIIAFLLDLGGSLYVLGHIIAAMDPSSTIGGDFSVSAFDVTLYGAAAAVWMALEVVYFVFMNRRMGGTVAKQMLGITGGHRQTAGS